MSDLRNEPVQARSSRTLDSIRAAAREVLDEYGVDEFTTALVAERARKSIGTVYRYYRDAPAILDDVLPGRRQSHDVLFERARQVAKGYTAQHDDERGPVELLDMSEQRSQSYAWKVTVGRPGDRAELVEALALCLAALEAHDRQVAAAGAQS